MNLVATTLFLLSTTALPTEAASTVNRSISWSDTDGISYSTNLIFRVEKTPNSESWSPCSASTLSTTCKAENNLINFTNILGPCRPDSENPCIQEVWIRTNGEWVKGIYKGSTVDADKVNFWPLDYIKGIDSPRQNNLFSFPSIKHKRGDLFEVNPIITGTSDHGGPISYGALKVEAAATYSADLNSLNSRDGCRSNGTDRNGASVVKLTDPCWKWSNADLNWQLKVVLQLPTAPAGWATGRLINSELSFSNSGNEHLPTLLTVTGSPSLVPSLERSFMKDNPVDYADWNKVAKIFSLPWDEYSRGPALGPSALNQFTQLIQMLPSMDRATGEQAMWSINFKWEKKPNLIPNTNCTSDSVLGYAGSNSLTFSTSIPQYDKSTGSFVYTVASPHSNSDGSIASGMYHLLLNSDVAKCIWRISGVPVKAEISVTDSNGNTKVVTSSMKVINNFISFTAAGFTFSKATISVRLPEDQTSAATPNPESSPLPVPIIESKPSPSPSPKASSEAVPQPSAAATYQVSKKITIVCIKGKSLKRVTAVTPKCPAGYKKK